MTSTAWQTYRPEQENAPIGEPFETPSAGDAFPFTVRMRWVWTGGSWGRSAIHPDVTPHIAAAWDRIMEVTRETCRGFAPDRAAEAEAELNRRLTALAADQQPVPDKAVWVARAEVDLHREVRDARRRDWGVAATSRAGHVAETEQVESYRSLIHSWRLLLSDIGLDDLQETPAPYLAPYLVRLAAHPERAAEIVMEMADRREGKDRELMEFLDAAIQGRGKVNLYEYDSVLDVALKRLMAWAGIKDESERS